MKLPETIDSTRQLEEVMTVPSPALVKMMGRLEGDIMILGIGGKMGSTLGRVALRAIDQAGVSKRIYGVSRFTDASVRDKLESFGIETISCDLLERDAVARLPREANVVFMAGKKFGTAGQEDLTWAMNTLVPAHVGDHYRGSRIVVFSTGNVYPFTPVDSGGASEQTPVNPLGDYAQSCLGRERVFTYFSRIYQTPMVLLRLFYAIDLRYGVLHDIGQKVLRDEPIDLSMGYANVIWQGDANCQALLCLEHCGCPPDLMNVTGPETICVKTVAIQLARMIGKEPKFQGNAAKRALLADTSKATDLFGPPRVPVSTLIAWTAHWLKSGGESLNKPSHFEVRDGNF
jgi:hypothetical protein